MIEALHVGQRALYLPSCEECVIVYASAPGWWSIIDARGNQINARANDLRVSVAAPPQENAGT